MGHHQVFNFPIICRSPVLLSQESIPNCDILCSRSKVIITRTSYYCIFRILKCKCSFAGQCWFEKILLKVLSFMPLAIRMLLPNFWIRGGFIQSLQVFRLQRSDLNQFANESGLNIYHILFCPKQSGRTEYQFQQGKDIQQYINKLIMTSENETAEDFLKIAPQFKLGCLLTEKQSPLTVGLSDIAKKDLPKAINIIKKLDYNTMKILESKIPQLQKLYQDVNDCLESGGKIFICGCGATGRLSLVLQTLWRQQTKEIYQQWSDRVVSFMAGGDAALIKSIEDFEDHPQFAQQQLIELGFQINDLLIGSTEGGETPWVIGAVWKAAQISKRRPYILYGNTDQILMQNVQRSRQFIQSEKINKINCNVGEMALAGSTRMQSTTILMHAIGIALLGCDRLRKIRYPNFQWKQYAHDNLQTIIKYIQQTDFTIISPLIEEQTDIYNAGEQITYLTDPFYAISILTDTTQRSPTFSLLPFKNKYTDPQDHKCWCNLKVLNQKSAGEQNWEKKVEMNWEALLGDRKIRGLDSEYWSKYKHKVSHEVILGFGLHEVYKHKLLIQYPLSFTSQKNKIKFPQFKSKCRLSQHSLIKIILNNMSTLIMGRMSRYESNIMTYVKPTNYKLIDRATRYVMTLRPESKYDEVVSVIYDIRKKIRPDQPIVLKVIQVLNAKKNQSNSTKKPEDKKTQNVDQSETKKNQEKNESK